MPVLRQPPQQVLQPLPCQPIPRAAFLAHGSSVVLCASLPAAALPCTFLQPPGWLPCLGECSFVTRRNPVAAANPPKGRLNRSTPKPWWGDRWFSPYLERLGGEGGPCGPLFNHHQGMGRTLQWIPFGGIRPGCHSSRTLQRSAVTFGCPHLSHLSAPVRGDLIWWLPRRGDLPNRSLRPCKACDFGVFVRAPEPPALPSPLGLTS